ncbi:MAG: DUF3084 domain-containing protein [Halanaerobium sp.]|nr:DUF3084 domain-containing protein [Halanaerobium sp.]
MAGIVLILAVIILSGIIAYFGDSVGRKVGKRRLTMLGLRPKYTSIVITILTGILIAAISITLVLVPSRGARMVLLDMQRAITELETLQNKVEEQENLLQEKQQEVRNLNQEKKMLTHQKEQIEKELQEKIDEYTQQIQDYEEKISSYQLMQEDLTSKIAELEKKKSELEASVAELEQNIADLKEENVIATRIADMFLGSALGDIVYRKGEVIFSRVIQGGQFDSESQVFTEIDDFIREAAEKIKKDVGLENTADINFIFDYYQLAQVLWKEDKPFIVRVLALQNTARGEEVNEVMAYLEYMENRIVFDKGDVIAEMVIPKAIDVSTEQGISELEGYMEELLNDVNKNAVKAGVIPSASGKVGSFDFAKFYRVVSQITDAEGPVVVRVVANQNIWRDDPLVDNINFTIEPLGE